MRGYIASSWDVPYYKCNTKGCKCNRNAHELNKQFEGMLDRYKIKDEHVPQIKQQLLLTFEQHNASLKDTEAGIIRQLTDIDQKLERLEERFILEELTAELYHKYKAKFEAEKQDLSNQMSHNRIEMSKLEDFISVALMFSINLSKMWALGDYTQRQELQNALFEDGIVYDRQKDECRSTGNNEFISEIVDLSGDLATLKETDSRNFNPSSPSSG